MFVWKEAITVQSIPRDRKKIAAVAVDTNQIANIFNSCYDAARTVLKVHCFTEPSQTITQNYAREIAKAAAAYHKEVLGYYWKWV